MHLRLASFLLVALAVSPAAAMMAPAVYEAARRDAPDVIVIAVTDVFLPHDGRNWGDCAVAGDVVSVERGTTHEPGDRIALLVPCAEPAADYPDSGTIYQRLPELLSATRARAWLAPDGQLALHQFEQLTEADLP